jgi:hypothetical protein
MAAYLLKHHKHDDKDPFWMSGYLQALHWSLGEPLEGVRHRHGDRFLNADQPPPRGKPPFLKRVRARSNSRPAGTSDGPASRSNCRLTIQARPWPRPTPSFSASMTRL